MHRRQYIAGSLIVAAALMSRVPTTLAGQPDYTADTLTGDWGGARTELVDRGVDLNLYYTGNFARNFTGGDKRASAYASGFEFVGAFDFGRLFGWKGGSFHLDIANFDGTLLDAKAHLGSLLSTEQIYAGHATYVANFYLEQSLWDGLVDLKYGRMDFVANFYTTPVITQFQNATFFGPQPGLMTNDVTTWPASAVGEAITIHPARAWKFTVANFAVQPNNSFVPSEGVKPWNRGHRIGNVIIAQAGVSTAFDTRSGGSDGDTLDGTWMVGGWHNSAPQPDLLLANDGLPRGISGAAPLIRRSAGGIYLTGQQQITRNAAGGGLVVFANLVHADSDVTLLDKMESVGVLYNAPFASRPKDSVGFAIGRNGISRRAAEAVRIENAQRGGKPLPIPKSEYVAELDYVVQFPRGISLMPNLQYVDHPGGTRAHRNYTVFGAQLNVTF